MIQPARWIPKYRQPVLVVLLGLLLAVVVHHVLVMVYGDQLRASILSGMYLLEGKPHWRLFQNRVLGPFVDRAFMKAAGLPDVGNILFDLTCFGTALVLAWRTGWLIVASRAGALAVMLTLALGLVSLFMGSWFYPWDIIGIALFMFFAWQVASGADYISIALLFAVTIWNRDDALFIALFLIVQPFAGWWRARHSPERPPIAWRQVILGMVCIVAGVALIVMLRRLLLVEEMGPKLFGVSPAVTPFFRWTLVTNFLIAVNKIPYLSLEMPAFVLVPPLVFTVSCVYLAFVRNGRYLAYALVNLGMVVSTLMFGFLPEIRIWVDMVPVLVLATAVALARADAPPFTPL